MYMPNYHDYRYYTLFDIACLTEQPSNTVRLHSLSRSYKLQALSRGITYEQSYGYVRVDTIRADIDYERLLPGCGELTQMTHFTFPPVFVYLFPGRHLKLPSHCELQCLAHSLVWLLGAYPSITYQRYLNTLTDNILF